MEGADQTYHHHTGRDRVCVGDTEDGGRRSDLPSSYWHGQSLCRGHRGWRAQIRQNSTSSRKHATPTIIISLSHSLKSTQTCAMLLVRRKSRDRAEFLLLYSDDTRCQRVLSDLST
ncbi:hypothetical protein RRG08_065434 [Elysia crispata]|uniref:Uncharacterized protein n=1 Tax=Elysia crispata TaxID=231223 RepID=A0AAE0ZFQ0_9GAST|nr:hypothetical protein RRG08_065434 [Elysia crispata]